MFSGSSTEAYSLNVAQPGAECGNQMAVGSGPRKLEVSPFVRIVPPSALIVSPFALHRFCVHRGRVHLRRVTESKDPREGPTQFAAERVHLLADTGASIRFTIKRVDGYLHADAYGRKTAEDTRRFLQAVADEALKSGVDRVLISVHASRPIFRVQQFGLSEFLETVASRPAHRIAIVADSFEGRLAQQYVVRIARERGLNIASFRSEEAAARWIQRA